MMPLPMCRWRERAADGLLCRSTKFAFSPNKVAPVFCVRCHCADHAPAPPSPPALPCVHLEDPAPGSDGAFACVRHGQCVPGDGTASAALRRCHGCSDYLPREPFGPTSRQMRRKADAFLAAVPPYPPSRYLGRGVVVAGGGDRYFPSLYVTIRALRHVGCMLPIQVWYFGRRDELPADKQAILEPYGVECVDADAIRLRHPARQLNGWELKVFATLHCRFEEVLFLDADCYPCRNPEFLFDREDYRACGAIFWPDMATFDDRLRWQAFGVEDPRRPGSVESGQYVVDKKRCWRPLQLAWHYNDFSDFYYRYCYGDKHTFEVAWTRCAQPFVMWDTQARWEDVAYVHPGPDKEPLFVHRCADKFRFRPQTYVTRQNHEVPAFHQRLPLERRCWGWLKDLARVTGRRDDEMPIPEEPDIAAALVVQEAPELQLVRLGSRHDGGYVVPDLGFEGIEGLYSFGVGDNIDFERDFQARTGGWIELFDPTIAEPNPLPSRARFHGRGLEGSSLAPLLDLGGRRMEAGARLWAKMDVEGAEWSALMATPIDVLTRFEVLIVEFHGLTDRTGWGRRREPEAIAKLNGRFRLVHAHANNFAPFCPRTKLPDCLEATYLRDDVLPADWRPNRRPLPGPHDSPCNPGAPELDLRHWPFMTSVGAWEQAY